METCATWKARPGEERRIKEIIATMTPLSRAEPGNLHYQAEIYAPYESLTGSKFGVKTLGSPNPRESRNGCVREQCESYDLDHKLEAVPISCASPDRVILGVISRGG